MSTANTAPNWLTRRADAVPRGAFNIAPLFVARAQGARVWDLEGRAYLDFCSGIGTLNVGHNHPRVVQAVHEQVDCFMHTCWHVAMYDPYVRLAERLNALVPMPGPNKTVLFNSGAEAVENAVKIARVHTGRPGVVVFERAFHGRTQLAMTLTGKVHPYTAGYGPFAPEVYRLPYRPFFDPPAGLSDDEVSVRAKQAMEDLFNYQIDANHVACVLMEPVLGEGGFYPAHPAAIRAVRQLCAANGILFVADEVQSGMGRCGALFACQRYGVVPDLVVMAKALAGGLPLSAVTGPAEVMDAPAVGGLGGTFGGNPVACVAACAVLDVLADEALDQRAVTIGQTIMDAFNELSNCHPHLVRARGLGAMCAIEVIDSQTGNPDAARTQTMLAEARKRGLLAMSASGNVIRALPPLIISDEELTTGLATLRATA